jgi:hypothetical protein
MFIHLKKHSVSMKGRAHSRIGWNFGFTTPNKPHKFGIKLYQVCEASSGYCLRFRCRFYKNSCWITRRMIVIVHEMQVWQNSHKSIFCHFTAKKWSWYSWVGTPVFLLIPSLSLKKCIFSSRLLSLPSIIAYEKMASCLHHLFCLLHTYSSH